VSKTVPAALVTHYGLGTTTVAHGLRIEREDGEIYRFTEHDEDDVISGIDATINGTYLRDPGLTVTDIAIASGCDVGNLEIRTLRVDAIWSAADIMSERWRNASFILFRYNHQSPSDGVEYVLSGTFGEIGMMRNEIVIELHDLRRYLNQPVGDQSSRTCRYRLGDARCMKDISAPPFTVSFAVTSVTDDNRIFRDSARLEAADYFGDGEVRWLTGDNAGAANKIKIYGVNGTFTLALPTILPIQVGDTGTAIVGCRKRRTEDCSTKFSNVLNFGGEPDRQGGDDISKSPTPTDLSAAQLEWILGAAF
jgi:uncharacterized phage protein (TIGR02218 family)